MPHLTAREAIPMIAVARSIQEIDDIFAACGVVDRVSYRRSSVAEVLSAIGTVVQIGATAYLAAVVAFDIGEWVGRKFGDAYAWVVDAKSSLAEQLSEIERAENDLNAARAELAHRKTTVMNKIAEMNAAERQLSARDPDEVISANDN